MSFAEDLRLFVDKVDRRSRDVFVGCVNEVFRSIVDGSEITGAPGQPVDTGFLKNSWTETFPEDWIGEIATSTIYAPAIEEGQQEAYYKGDTFIEPGPMTLRSSVGGFHSVKLTVTNWDRIVEYVRNKVVGI